jgi:hypothetical protein
MKFIYSVAFIFIFHSISISRDSDSNLPSTTSSREEIQRYAGYEELPILYISLIYDTLLGSNIPVLYLDTGFILLVILPFLLITFNFRHNRLKWMLYLLFVGILFFLIIPSSYQTFLKSGLTINGPLKKVLSEIFIEIIKFLKPSFGHISDLISSFTSYFSIITYPFLFIIFFIFLIGFGKLFSEFSKEIQFLSISLLSIIFLWNLSSSGIPWYGLLAFPIGLIIISKRKHFAIVFLILFQLMLHLSARLSRYEDPNKKSNQLFDSASAAWQTNQINQIKYKELLTGLPIEVIDYLNKDNDNKIFRVGTNLHFFLNKNDQRVFQDNHLDFFNAISSRKLNINKVNKILKKRGFEFMIVDLTYYSLDKTPEKSLIRKYDLFFEYLSQNNGIRLIYTDRIILDKKEGVAKNGIGGKDQKIMKHGTIAIFQII